MKIKPRMVLAVALAVASTGELPTEFRMFVPGWNDTEKGQFLFDDAAAKSVMAASTAWNVRHMIDLEHQSLDAPVADPTARDARGWFDLQVREDGSLWAVNVEWTKDGAARLLEKRQKYVSPAFDTDAEGRVTKIVNVAITALPATHGTPALTSIRDRRDRRALSAGDSFMEVQDALSAALRDRFPSDNADPCSGIWVMDVFDASVVYQLEGKLFEVTYTFTNGVATLGPTPTEVKRAYAPIAAASPTAAPNTPASPVASAAKKNAGAKLAAGETKMLDAKQIQEALDAIAAGDEAKALEILKGIIATAAGGEPPPAGEPPAPDPQAESMMAAARLCVTLSGKSTPGEAMTEIERLVKLALSLETDQKKLAADRAALEATERRSLVASLVQLGVEIPATAFVDALAPTPVICERLAKEPIEGLRARVKQLSSVRPGGTPSGGAVVVPPAGTGASGAKTIQTKHGSVELSASELAQCEDAAKERGSAVDTVIANYAANKAERLSKRGGK